MRKSRSIYLKEDLQGEMRKLGIQCLAIVMFFNQWLGIFWRVSNFFSDLSLKPSLKLTGIVNRMSEDHIGCVCHKYFNATIKRPEEASYELWKNKKIFINQSITFRVKDLDYTGAIPVIEGDFADYKKYFPESASSESGVEDMVVPKKTSKKKK